MLYQSGPIDLGACCLLGEMRWETWAEVSKVTLSQNKVEDNTWDTQDCYERELS